ISLCYICYDVLNTSVFALMIKYVFLTVIERLTMYTIAGWEVYGMEIIITTIALLVFGYFNVKGTGLTGRMQFIFAVIMVIGVIALTFMVGLQPGSGVSNVKPLFPAETTALDRKSVV